MGSEVMRVLHLRLRRGLQLAELLVPEYFQKTPQLRKSLWPDAIEPPRAVSPFRQQSCLDEYPQMLRNGGPRGAKMPGNFPRAQFLRTNQPQNRYAPRLRQRSQNGLCLFQTVLMRTNLCLRLVPRLRSGFCSA